MATVKLSDSLCHDINNNAERVFTKRIQSYAKNNPIDVSGWGDKIYDTIIPEHLQDKVLPLHQNRHQHVPQKDEFCLMAS